MKQTIARPASGKREGPATRPLQPLPVQKDADPAVQRAPIPPRLGHDIGRLPVQRQGDEDELQAKPANPGALQRQGDEEELQAKAEPSTVAQASSSPGSGLPAPVRSQMERAFGTDFSDVRVHQGAQARSIGALAYTQGSDIHFQPGRYDPRTERGRQLLGHELAHVVQQRSGRVSAPQGKGVPINADPGLEAEADRLGEAAAAGRAAEVAGAGSGIQRKPQAIQRDGDEGVELATLPARSPASQSEAPSEDAAAEDASVSSQAPAATSGTRINRGRAALLGLGGTAALGGAAGFGAWALKNPESFNRYGKTSLLMGTNLLSGGLAVKGIMDSAGADRSTDFGRSQSNLGIASGVFGAAGSAAGLVEQGLAMGGKERGSEIAGAVGSGLKATGSSLSAIRGFREWRNAKPGEFGAGKKMGLAGDVLSAGGGFLSMAANIAGKNSAFGKWGGLAGTVIGLAGTALGALPKLPGLFGSLKGWLTGKSDDKAKAPDAAATPKPEVEMADLAKKAPSPPPVPATAEPQQAAA